MAYSPSPTSPTHIQAHHIRRSPSPQPHPVSKKDKKRQAHNAHYQELVSEFSQNRDIHFRSQLVALQHDMAIVQRADIYQPEPIDDSPDEIRNLLESSAAGTPFQGEVSSAGRWYNEFVRQVNEAKEEREIELVRVLNNYESTLVNLKRECDYKLRHANEECKLLSRTVKDRFTHAIQSRINSLMKEKEQLDSADTNSLLHHSSQFAITNPSSPGGAHTSRKTRLTRNRGDAEELGNTFLSDNFNKRKRKALDDDPGSPGYEGTSTPGERARARMANYSLPPTNTINIPFTDKELNQHSYRAHIAASDFFSNSRKNGKHHHHSHTHDANSSSSSIADSSPSSPENEANPPGADLSAPDMDRTVSNQTYHHLTRSARNAGGGLSGLSLLSEIAADKSASSGAAAAAYLARNSLPALVQANFNSKNGQVILPPSSLNQEEMEDDLRRIEEGKDLGRGWVDEKLLEEVCRERNGVENLAPDWTEYKELAGTRMRDTVVEADA
ncbi:MAG: hypothetical protein Q9227_003893 [Pyrenula ochraceoflavens]